MIWLILDLTMNVVLIYYVFFRMISSKWMGGSFNLYLFTVLRLHCYECYLEQSTFLI